MNTKRIHRLAPIALCLPAIVAYEAQAAEIERVGDGAKPRLKVDPDGSMHVIASSREGIYHHHGNTGAWTGELIAGTDNVSTAKWNQPFLGIAPDGTLQVIYGPPAHMPGGVGQPTHGLFYTVNSGAGWGAPQNILDLYIEYEAIETDAAGVPLIAALVVTEPATDPADRTNYGGVTWLRYEGGTWSAPIQLRSALAKYATLVRDEVGRIHLVVRWKYVHYSVYTGGAWHNLPDSGDTFDNILLPDTNFSMSAPSIFVSPDGTVHAVAAADRQQAPDFPWEQARYAFNDGSGWSGETGGKEGEMVMEGDINLCSVGVDSTDTVHIFCVDGGGNLLHTSGRTGSFSGPEVLDTGLSPTVDLPPFDTVFTGGRIHTVYAKPDGVYHLYLDPPAPPADENVEEAAEVPAEPMADEDIEAPAEQQPERPDGDGGEASDFVGTGGCGCWMAY